MSKNKLKRYSNDKKHEMISRMLPPENISANQLSKETGISISTLCKWKNTKLSEDTSSVGSNRKNRKWSTEDKFHIVLETYSLTEEELAAYCRKKGLYVDEIKGWRNQCLKANLITSKDPQIIEDELKEKIQTIKNLEKELRYKEKALAETAALLVLRKKAQAIWGDPEDE